MSFAVLDPLDVRRDGRPIEVGGRRPRALLTLPLLDAGRTVSTEALVAGVWDDRPPSGAGNALQALVFRLRATAGRDLVAGGPSGHRLAVSSDQVDLHLFARDGRAPPRDAGERACRGGHPAAPEGDTPGLAEASLRLPGVGQGSPAWGGGPGGPGGEPTRWLGSSPLCGHATR